LPGETVEVEVTEIKKRFARARLVRVEQPSPERIAPACRYFGACGGCQYQHLSYPAQLQLKRKQVADILQRIGGLDPALVAPVRPCPQPYGYRNRIMVRSQWDKFKQGLNLGFLRADSRLVVDVEECRIATPELNRLLQQARQHPPPRGGLKVLLRKAPPGWEVPRDSFFQNNLFMLPELVSVARDRLKQGGGRYLVDAYCGVGFFSVELADAVESFVGIEYDRLAVAAARRNAQARQLIHGEYRLGKTEELLPAVLERFPIAQTTVLLDPPRTGCVPGCLRQLGQSQPNQVLYVSCHPATLARDLNILCQEQVYRVMQVIPLDMFPQTQHVECVADVRRNGRADGTPVASAIMT